VKRLEMLKTVYDESILRKNTVFKRHKRFRKGTEYVNDDERQGTTVTKRTEENVAKTRKFCDLTAG
jgi:hypothetical protein